MTEFGSPGGSKTPERLSVKLTINNHVYGMTTHNYKSIWSCDNLLVPVNT